MNSSFDWCGIHTHVAQLSTCIFNQVIYSVVDDETFTCVHKRSVNVEDETVDSEKIWNNFFEEWSNCDFTELLWVHVVCLLVFCVSALYYTDSVFLQLAHSPEVAKPVWGVLIWVFCFSPPRNCLPYIVHNVLLLIKVLCTCTMQWEFEKVILHRFLCIVFQFVKPALYW